jgi:hypothetical protein
MSAGAAVTNLGSNFLERLGNQATCGFGSALRNNPGGGGASKAVPRSTFRWRCSRQRSISPRSASNTARLYVNYDGKLRAATHSHQGTVGVELKW